MPSHRISWIRGAAGAALIVATCAAMPWVPVAAPAEDGIERPDVEAFRFTERVTVDASPEEAFDAFTGDISAWWDHTFSGAPARLVIEPFAGGRFLEDVDDDGHGITHARVTWAERGGKLVMVGPLGLHGQAVEIYHTLTFTAADDGRTAVDVRVEGLGVLGPFRPEVIREVWRHFLTNYVAYTDGGGR